MTKRRKPPLTSQEKLDNLSDSLVEDILAGHIEIDKGEAEEAYRKGQEIIEKARSSKKGSPTEAKPEQEWTEKTANQKTRKKGHEK